MTIAFELAEQEFIALNGGPHFNSERQYPEKSQRVTKAMLQMKKFDIAVLERGFHSSDKKPSFTVAQSRMREVKALE